MRGVSLATGQPWVALPWVVAAPDHTLRVVVNADQDPGLPQPQACSAPAKVNDLNVSLPSDSQP